MATIVVGVDGSEGGDAALRWALDEARLRGSRLRVVHVFDPPQAALSGTAVGAAGVSGPVVLAPEDEQRIRAAAEVHSRGVIDSALDRVGAVEADGPEIERAALPGAPAQTLIESARDAELLVLGTRGRGGFLGLLLGSVAQQIAHHPPCPVVILPATQERESSA
jgi:nucleotide-binding universal stress UspA family protein